MSDATDQFLSHLGKWLCDLANNSPTESSRGWLRRLAEQHSYSALPWVRDGVEQIEREMLRLRKQVNWNEKMTDTQTVIDLTTAMCDERQEHRAAIAKLQEALYKCQPVIDEAVAEATKELTNESWAPSPKSQNHETQCRLLIKERDAANAALNALCIEHDAVLEDLYDAKERRSAALHYLDQLRSILGPNLEAWHDSDSVAGDSDNESNEEAAPADHCRSLSIRPSSRSTAASPTQKNGTQNSPLSLEQPTHSQQKIHLLNRREQDFLKRIHDLETENEELREELQLSEQLHAVTDAEISDLPDEPPTNTEEIVKSCCQLDGQQRPHEGRITAQETIASNEGSDESCQEGKVGAGWRAWRAPRMTEDLKRALNRFNDWHRSHFHVMH